MDILFHTDEYVFSYRVAGICIQKGKVLLQKPINDTAFAFPGGQVSLGETNAQTLEREFQEEIGVDICVFGHLHSHSCYKFKIPEGISCKICLVSADYLQFLPKKIG